MDKKTGGPAFPTDKKMHEITHQEYPSQFPGMTLRDWFAGQALAGEMATRVDNPPEEHAEKVAHRCYALADAMLAERDKEE